MEKRNPLLAVIILALPVMTGLSMPSCPGQEEMQSKVDSTQQELAALKARNQVLSQDLAALKEDYVKTKTLLSEVGNSVLAQKTAIEQIDANVKTLVVSLQEMRTRAPARPAARKPLPKKR